MATLRWASPGLAVVMAIAMLSHHADDDALAATVRAMDAAPAIHIVTTQGPAFESPAMRSEAWIVPGLGSYIDIKGSDCETIWVDDLVHEYQYWIPRGWGPNVRPRVQIGASQMRDPHWLARFQDWTTGTRVLKQLRSQMRGKPVAVELVQSEGRRLRRLRLPDHQRQVSPEAYTVYIDPETDRILWTEGGGPGSRSQRQEYDYPDPTSIDRRRFHFVVPAGATVWDETDDPIRWASGDAATCMNQIRALREALRRYANDHHGRWPKTLRPALDRYVSSPAVFRCPPAPAVDGTSYAYHAPGVEREARVLAYWNQWKAAPGAISLPAEAWRLGAIRPPLLECRYHAGYELSLYHSGWVVRRPLK